MALSAFVGVLVVLLFMGGIVWLVVRTVRSARARVQAASAVQRRMDELLGGTGAQPRHGSFDLDIGGRAVRIHTWAGGKNSSPTLRVELPVDVRLAGNRTEQGVYRDAARRRVTGNLAVLFRKETGRDRFGKRIGLNAEHETKDREFDLAVYIETDASRQDLDAVLGDATTRGAVREILAMGYSRVEMFRGASSLQATFVNPTVESVDQVKTVVDRLGAIADNLPSFGASPVGRAVPLRTSLAGIIGIVTAIGGGVFAAVASKAYQVITPGAIGRCVLLGLGGWVIVSVLAFLLFRGKSDALRAFSFVFFTQIIGLPALAAGTGAGLNAWLDTGPATAHEPRVLRKWYTTSKNSKTYKLEIECWRPDRKSFERSVPSGLYAAVHQGGRVRVVSRPGGLGWEWISNIGPAR